MVKVNLKDPAVQAKVKSAGIRWNIKDYEKGLELTDAQMLAAGLDAKTAKVDAKASAKAEVPVADSSVPGPPKGPLRGTGNPPKGSKE